MEREVRTERTAIRPAGAKPVRLSACRQKCHGARGVVHPDSTCRNQIGPTILINPCRHFSNSFLRWGSYICGSSAANGTCPHSAIWKLRHAQTTLRPVNTLRVGTEKVKYWKPDKTYSFKLKLNNCICLTPANLYFSGWCLAGAVCFHPFHSPDHRWFHCHGWAGLRQRLQQRK